MSPTFSGGKLNLKGSKKKAKKKSKKSKHEKRKTTDTIVADAVVEDLKKEHEGGEGIHDAAHEYNHDLRDSDIDSDRNDGDNNSNDDDDDLTPAERRSLNRKKRREREESEKIGRKSHRERVEEFNEKLGNLTEHNDIPRVSLFYIFILSRGV